MTNEQYYDFTVPYQDAMNLLLARLNVLNHSLYSDSAKVPIHNIQSRIKKKQSMEDKLERQSLSTSVFCAKDNLLDIAGIRVICYFIKDVYSLVEALRRQDGLILIREKDYIRKPKPNGYRGYHVILGMPVCYMNSTEYYPVEVQIRTIGMDFWASMEHRVCYKQERNDKEEIQGILLEYAGTLMEMEKDFEKYNERR